MDKNQMKFSCKIYFEAEDVSQSRIISTTSAVQNVFKNSKNPFISAMKVEDENDMDDFILRVYAGAEIEDICEDMQDAEMLAPQLAELLTELAQAHSYLDMEGSFSVECGDLQEAYRIKSESGDDLCDFELV